MVFRLECHSSRIRSLSFHDPKATDHLGLHHLPALFISIHHGPDLQVSKNRHEDFSWRFYRLGSSVLLICYTFQRNDHFVLSENEEKSIAQGDRKFNQEHI